MKKINLFIKLLFIVFSVNNSKQNTTQEPIVDKKTHEELPLMTNTYYSIKNQKTERYLIWFGKNDTIPGEPEVNQGKFWHIFEKSDQEYYNMGHQFGNHTVKIAKSHEDGYYQIFNRDCMYANSPNGDCSDSGMISCFPPDEGDFTEFNWVFSEKA